MFLQQWIAWTGERADLHMNGQWTVITQGLSDDQIHHLYRLKDYVVSTVSGVVVWLRKVV